MDGRVAKFCTILVQDGLQTHRLVSVQDVRDEGLRWDTQHKHVGSCPRVEINQGEIL